MEGKAIRRPGGDWSIQRIDKADHYQTVLYEIDMLRFCCGRIVKPPGEASEADVWVYLESFLVHYRNLLDFFGKEKQWKKDLTMCRPEAVWSAEAGVADRMPPAGEIS